MVTSVVSVNFNRLVPPNRDDCLIIATIANVRNLAIALRTVRLQLMNHDA